MTVFQIGCPSPPPHRAAPANCLFPFQAVSGKPRFAWFFGGPKLDSELQEALRRQEELNARAAGWLLGLQTQREVRACPRACVRVSWSASAGTC